MLLDISKKVAAIESLDEVIAAMVEMTTWELGAERGTLFLNDPQTGELYSRFAQGVHLRELRILNTSGIAGAVFNSGKGEIVHEAYKDKRFNRTVDEQTGFRTKSILCVPVKTVKGEIIGACQILNKKKGRFNKDDLQLLEAMTMQASISLQSTQFVERMKKTREQEMEFLDVVSDVTSEIELGTMLKKVMSEATRMLNADRSSLFLHDEKTNELWLQVGEGLGATEIRMPNHIGIAGAVFTTGQTINIPHAYADLRFNPAFDKQTGYFTRSILCVPVVNKDGKVLGATQVLNRRGGPFTEEDEQRLKAFTAQVSIGLENAQLFDEVQKERNYNESMLSSMSNGVVTLDEDGKIATCNAAGLRLMQVGEDEVLGQEAKEFFTGKNAWVMEWVNRVEEEGETEYAADAELEFGEEQLSVNVTIMPLLSSEDDKLGSMIMIEDISSEKRMKSTMSRYMDPGLADQLMEGGEDILGGQSTTATILFSDVRGFTTITEELGAKGTVQLLNDYFTIMVDCITREEGMLDKFIGDAIMAAFGVPVSHDDDEDRAMRAAVAMITELWEWNKERESNGQMPVDMGIGLNTDNVVSGNIGSPKRMDYTMIGDGVNLAARLESACKQYAARILISENTYTKLRGTFRAREVDRVVVKGKTEAVAVYEVLDYHNEETFPNVMEVLNHFKDGLEKYRGGKWDPATKAFKEALKLNPGDFVSTMYIERCAQLKADPPKKWDGVWVMTSK
ncbi:MAG: GAF domain-containing protein [Alphaproteobacteria bacterium]|nr:GAF domain-containing protein [Alphaproteobacteria bacterium]